MDMKTNWKNISLISATVLGLTAAVWYVWHWLFSDDAAEGDFKLFGKKPADPMQKPSTIPNATINDITAKLPKHPTKKYGTRSRSAIQQIVVHHSATPSSAAGSTPQAYAKYHIEQRGWAGIGYHFVIQPNGTIYQTNALTTVSNHVQNANTRSIGICLSGNFDQETPTGAAVGSLIWLIRSLSQDLGRQLPLRAHNEFAPKSCPGAGISVAQLATWAYNQ